MIDDHEKTNRTDKPIHSVTIWLTILFQAQWQAVKPATNPKADHAARSPAIELSIDLRSCSVAMENDTLGLRHKVNY